MTGGSGAPAPLQPAQRPVGRAGCGRVAGGSPKYLAGALSVLTLFGVVVGPRGWHSCCSGRPLSRPAAWSGRLALRADQDRGEGGAVVLVAWFRPW